MQRRRTLTLVAPLKAGHDLALMLVGFLLATWPFLMMLVIVRTVIL